MQGFYSISRIYVGNAKMIIGFNQNKFNCSFGGRSKILYKGGKAAGKVLEKRFAQPIQVRVIDKNRHAYVRTYLPQTEENSLLDWREVPGFVEIQEAKNLGYWLDVKELEGQGDYAATKEEGKKLYEAAKEILKTKITPFDSVTNTRIEKMKFILSVKGLSEEEKVAKAEALVKEGHRYLQGKNERAAYYNFWRAKKIWKLINPTDEAGVNKRFDTMCELKALCQQTSNDKHQ
jgi:hypothetical protein